METEGETEEQNKKVCHSTQSIHTAVCVINSVMRSLTSLGRCLSSKQTNLCVRKTVSLHTIRRRERTLNAQTTQNGTESDFCLWGEKREFCLPVSQCSPNSPLSWSVIQQKNGSIKSWSSPCQVTPRKWVLKLFFWRGWGVEMEEAKRAWCLKWENESCAS